jgi:riboflavin kinase/FMN adenylyltransferase
VSALRIVRDLGRPVYEDAKSVVTIGAFDGIHRGHVKILKEVAMLARGIEGRGVVVTFEPHPISVVRPDERPCLLTDPEEKAFLIEGTGVDDLVTMDFTPKLASSSADWFLEEVLLGKLGMRRLVIGYDFRFGKSREGDAAYLERAGEKLGFGVDIVPPLLFMEHPVSSTRVRTALARGEVEVAAEMLGRPYSISGEVVRGEGRGQSLEYPTANLKASDPRKMVPPDGVYAVTAVYGGKRAPGALYIGVRPTYGGKARSIEVYVIDTTEAPEYGGALTIEFVGRVRGEMAFDTDAALRAQIAEDVGKIRGIMGISP